VLRAHAGAGRPPCWRPPRAAPRCWARR
jgi:hypothetical protein